MSTHRADILVHDRFSAYVNRARLTEIALAVLDYEEATPVALAISITDDQTVRKLNRLYTGSDKPTDVLSFSQTDGESPMHQPQELQEIGDIVISYPAAVRQAKEQGCATDTELAHLLTHGVLHLMGHNHTDPEGNSRMKDREEKILSSLLGSRAYTHR